MLKKTIKQELEAIRFIESGITTAENTLEIISLDLISDAVDWTPACQILCNQRLINFQIVVTRNTHGKHSTTSNSTLDSTSTKSQSSS